MWVVLVVAHVPVLAMAVMVVFGRFSSGCSASIYDDGGGCRGVVVVVVLVVVWCFRGSGCCFVGSGVASYNCFRLGRCLNARDVTVS